MTYALPFEAVVPANASRFFRSRDLAIEQPEGAISLAWDDADPYIFNAAFDSRLIRYDDAYCTSVVDIDRIVQVPTIGYFQQAIRPHLRPDPIVIDIGCGQGEFVDYLTSIGVQATGYDPVLRREDDRLIAQYWTPDAAPADLSVMRCVLPHIAKPWDFLADIATSSPGSLVLIEFQRTDWALSNSLWYQISHDHVNLFRTEDFEARYRVVASGSFAAGEWSWVLIDPRIQRFEPAPDPREAAEAFRRLAEIRRLTLHAVALSGRPIALWGAAGKGIVLAHALADHASDLHAIDADPARWGLFMETSGVEVTPPDLALDRLEPRCLILVCNPNHLDAVSERVAGRFDVCLPVSLVGGD